MTTGMGVLLRLGAAVAAGAIAFVAADAAAVTKWTGGGINAPNAPVTLGARKFADLVKERTNGELLIEYFDSEKLGPANQQIESLSAGTQHVYISSGVAVSNLVPEYGLLDMAFLFRDQQHMDKFLESDMMDDLNRKLVQGFGIRTIAMNWYRMPRYYLHRSKFVSSPEDIKGQRARSPNLPVHLQNWINIGAVPVKIDYQEQYLAIRQGVVDMTEISGEQLYSMKLHEVAPYITDCFFAYPQASVFVNDRAFQRLDKKTQQVVVDAAKEAGVWQSGLVVERFQPEWNKVMAEGGKFQAMSEAQRAQFRSLTEKAIPEMEQKGLIPKGWYQRIMALK